MDRKCVTVPFRRRINQYISVSNQPDFIARFISVIFIFCLSTTVSLTKHKVHGSGLGYIEFCSIPSAVCAVLTEFSPRKICAVESAGNRNDGW